MSLTPNLFSARTAVLISGRGSNLQALLDKEGCNIRLVVSNKRKAPGVLKSKRAGCVTWVMSPLNFEDLIKKLKDVGIKKIILLGFMRLLPEAFVTEWSGKIINLHPSLLPLFPGLDSIEKSFQSESDMGISLHTVIPAMDEGPILNQSRVYSGNRLPKTSQEAHWAISFREHYIIRRMGDKWI